MKIIKVKNISGIVVSVDSDSKKTYTFNNEEKKITYCANLVNDRSEPTIFWTEFEVKGTLDNVNEKLTSFTANCALVKLYYTVNSITKDSQEFKQLVEHCLKYVKDNQTLFFRKSGDFKKNQPTINWLEVLK